MFQRNILSVFGNQKLSKASSEMCNMAGVQSPVGGRSDAKVPNLLC